MTYEYRVVSLPAARKQKGESMADAGERHLSNVLTNLSNQGWEFQARVDVPVFDLPGCWGQLNGKKNQFASAPQLVFRRPKQ